MPNWLENFSINRTPPLILEDQFVDATIYRRTGNVASLNEAVDIALVVAQNPANSTGFVTPGGPFITERQYALLPGHLRVHFTAEAIRVKRNTQ